MCDSAAHFLSPPHREAKTPSWPPTTNWLPPRERYAASEPKRPGCPTLRPIQFLTLHRREAKAPHWQPRDQPVARTRGTRVGAKGWGEPGRARAMCSTLLGVAVRSTCMQALLFKLALRSGSPVIAAIASAARSATHRQPTTVTGCLRLLPRQPGKRNHAGERMRCRNCGLLTSPGRTMDRNENKTTVPAF